jgi:hypothetical protein
MTTYCSIQDLDSLLEGFVSRYYGTYLNDGEDLTIGTQFSADQWITFQETNEWLQGIPHIKQLPIGTQIGGNFPIHIRMLQSPNLSQAQESPLWRVQRRNSDVGEHIRIKG